MARNQKGSTLLAALPTGRVHSREKPGNPERTKHRSPATPCGVRGSGPVETGVKNPGSVLLSHTASRAVPSAPTSLTSEFGMGSGVASSISPPETLGQVSQRLDLMRPCARERRGHRFGWQPRIAIPIPGASALVFVLTDILSYAFFDAALEVWSSRTTD